MSRKTRTSGSSRRDFLKGVGTAGAGLAVGSLGAGAGVAPAAAGPSPSTSGAPGSSVDFGRIFPDLPSFAEPTDEVRAALQAVGQRGGILDAQDNLAAGPKALIVDPTVNGNPTLSNPYGTNPDNPTMTAGSTFVGQFIDHDVTFDQTSQLGVTQNPLTSPNTRTPALDLDPVFGGGPGIRPDLYVENKDGTVGPKLKIGSTMPDPSGPLAGAPFASHEDVPRVSNGDGTYSALLGDPRNDENIIIAGLHCAHILFYNRVLDQLDNLDLSAFPTAQNDQGTRYDKFLQARQVTQWHYQWLLVNEHLVQIAGQAMVNDVLKNGNRFYNPSRGAAFMPIEFGAAAYRFGHSMVRPSYRANFSRGTGDSTSPTKNPFFGLVFDATGEAASFSGPIDHDRDDLLGGYPGAQRYIGWQTFFDFGDGQVKPNKKIDTTISSVLFTLPVPAIAPGTQTSPTVLPQRNLLRALTWSLPSGQAVATAMGAPQLDSTYLADIADVYAPFGTSTPLWYWILAEAKATTNGLTFGPVGGRIVTETLIGLLRADPNSYLSNKPGFKPFLGTNLKLGSATNPNITGNRSYTRAHFLYYAGVVKPGIYR